MSRAATPAEHALVFGCEGDALVGILHRPAAGAPCSAGTTGVVVIVGGPQYRAGSHRQFVHLARTLAAAGHTVLRFDVRGMGDSTGGLHDFEQITPDIGAAIDALQQHAPQIQQVMLWGLCDAASAALLYMHDRPDPRVRGLCLVNPWMRSAASLARTHVKHYYLRRMVGWEFWAKLLRGQIGTEALAGLVQTVRMAFARSSQPPTRQQTFQQRMAMAWNEFQHGILLLLSSDDYTAKEFLEYIGADAAWARALRHPHLQQRAVAGADHTFSRIADRLCMEEVTVGWLKSLQAPRRS